jgi:hypothetical protein
MKVIKSKLMIYLIPSLLAVFIFIQLVAPGLGKALGYSAISKNQMKDTVDRKPAASGNDVRQENLNNIPSGKYYSYRANYSCKTYGKKNSIPSFADSYEIQNGKFCKLGDACQSVDSKRCYDKLPPDISFAKDFSNFTKEKEKFRKQISPIPEHCSIPSCAAPADICKFDELPPLDDEGCPQGCGTIVCKLGAEICPELNCAAPPQNCIYDGAAPLDANGCATGCGNLICESVRNTGFKCPVLNCPKPPENCNYDNSAGFDENGCSLGCGQLKCRLVQEKLNQCARQPQCATPPEGCFYAGEPARDSDGCVVGCGSLHCKKNIPKKCRQPVCDPPGERCRYDGNAPLDFNGCSTGCGNLICNSDETL